MYTTKCKNSMLDAFGIAYISAHDGYPGLTGANELSGGAPAYARKAITFGSAASGVKSATTTPTFDIPAGKTVRYIGFWDAVTSGNFLGFSPNGGSEKEITVDIAADKVLYDAHGYSSGDKVVMYGTTLPAPFVAGTIYFVINPTTNNFQLAATVGGSVIDITADGSYDCVISKIVEESFGAQGQHQLTSLALNLNG